MNPGDRALAGLRAGGSLLDRHAGSPCGVVAVLDLDRFGQVNSRRGSAAGDALLATIERGLWAAVAGSGHAVALGGDQFLVLVPGPADPSVLGRRLLDAVRQARVRTGPGRAAWASASAGLARWTQPDGTVDTALRSAGRALSAAKTAGGNRWAVS